MHLRSALVASIFALQASAFLVPLEISKAAEAAKGQIESIWSQSAHSIELDCPGCPILAPAGSKTEWDEDDENRLVFDFAIDHEQSLQINGRTVFSVMKQIPPPSPLSVSQVRNTDNFKTVGVPIGWALEVPPPVTNTAEPGKELYTLQFTVLDIKGVPVEVDTIRIDLLKQATATSTPTISIVQLSPVSFSSTPGAESCQHSSQWSLCRLRAIIAARLRTMLESVKKHAGAAKTWAKGCKGKKGQSGEHRGPFGGHRGPFGGQGQHGSGEGRPHRGHHGQHHQGHRFGHMLHQTLRFFVVPALLGVIGGLLASAVGMLVGRLIVFIWTRFHRGGRRGDIRIIEVAVEEDEKDALVLETRDLPPRYTDVEAVVVKSESR